MPVAELAVLRARLDALRDAARGIDSRRLGFAEALARRAESAPDGVRQRVAQRLAEVLDELVAGARSAPGPRPSKLSPLGELLAYIGAREAELGGEAPSSASPAPELRTVRYFRRDWSRLSTIQQLTEALAQVPENAGPLNSHHLALRAMKAMHDTSPEYLKRFLSYVDALLWLDQAEQAARPPAKAAAKDSPRPRARRPARGR